MMQNPFLEILLQLVPTFFHAVAAIVALLLAVKWPVIRGKHALLAYLAVVVASAILYCLWITLLTLGAISHDDGLFLVLRIVLYVASAVSSVLLVVLVVLVAVLGADLREMASEYPRAM